MRRAEGGMRNHSPPVPATIERDTKVGRRPWVIYLGNRHKPHRQSFAHRRGQWVRGCEGLYFASHPMPCAVSHLAKLKLNSLTKQCDSVVDFSNRRASQRNTPHHSNESHEQEGKRWIPQNCKPKHKRPSV